MKKRINHQNVCVRVKVKRFQPSVTKFFSTALISLYSFSICRHRYSRELELLVWVNYKECLELLELEHAVLANVHRLHHGHKLVVFHGDSKLSEEPSQLVD